MPVDSQAYHARFAQGQRFAREIRVEVEIDAPVAEVWSVLTDFERYPQWNPFTVAVHTSLEVGSKVELHVRMPGRPQVQQREWVNLVEPPRHLCWGLRWAGGHALLTNRHQRLEALGEGRTRYITYDEFSGWLVPLVFALYERPMRGAFTAMASALRDRCEAAARVARA